MVNNLFRSILAGIVISLAAAKVIVGPRPAECLSNEVYGCVNHIVMGDILARCDTFCEDGKKLDVFGTCEQLGLDPSRIPPISCKRYQEGDMPMCSGCQEFGCVCRIGWYRDTKSGECEWTKKVCRSPNGTNPN